jgi:hypothetical protein
LLAFAVPGVARAAAPPADASQRPGGTADEQLVTLTGSAELRTLAIIDETPQNDTSVNWALRADTHLYEGGTVYARLGVLQRFVAPVGDTGLRLQDLSLGATYAHTVELVSFVHRLAVSLPTSGESQRQLMYAAPTLASVARVTVLERLTLGLTGSFQYRFHGWAESDEGRGNNQLVMGGGLSADVSLIDSDVFGSLSVGADISTTWLKRYPSIPNHVSTASDQTFWLQDYGWGAYAYYTPWPFLSASLGIEQGGSLLDEGIVRAHFLHRDETELVVRIIGRY